MKIQTFKVKATVKKGNVTLDHSSRELLDSTTDGESFDDKDIPKKAQVVAESNNIEQQAIKEMGDGEYFVEWKIIV